MAAVGHKLVVRRFVVEDIDFVELADLVDRTLDFVRTVDAVVDHIEFVAECKAWKLVLDTPQLLEVTGEIGSLHIRAEHLVVG